MTVVAFSLDRPKLHFLAPVSSQILMACQRSLSGTDLVAGLDAEERTFIVRKLRSLSRRGLIETGVSLGQSEAAA